MGMNFSCDNVGNRIPPHPNMSAPVAGSGILVTCTTADTNYTTTVEAGATYKVSASKTSDLIGNIIAMSITGTAVTDANKEWVFNLGKSCVIKIPNDKTILNITATEDLVLAHLIKLQG